jgi:hypothetical protein
MYVDLNQATEAPAISLQVASRDREGFELTCIMKPCSRKDLCFVAGEKPFAAPRLRKPDKQIAAGLGGTALHIGGQIPMPQARSAMPIPVSRIISIPGCCIFEAVVWTLTYLKPSSDEGPKSIRGLNMRAAPSRSLTGPSDWAVNGGAE